MSGSWPQKPSLPTERRARRTRAPRTSLQQQVTSIGDETAALSRQSEELALQLEGLRGEKLRLEIRQRELEQEWDAARTRVTQMEDHLRMGRQSLQELREQRSHAEVDRAKNDSDRQHLRETCISEVNAQPEDLIATEAAFMSGEELAIAETNYREMKQRIESMGPVNMMALEEFNECEQRFTFLTRERDDLLQSIADTSRPSPSSTSPPKKSLSTPSTPSTRAFRSLPHHFRRRHGRDALDRAGQLRRRGHRHRRIASGQAPAKRAAALRRRKGYDRAGAAHCHLPLPTKPLLHPDEVDAPLDEANVGASRASSAK